MSQLFIGCPTAEIDLSDERWRCSDPVLFFEADHRLFRFQLVELLSQRSRLLMFKAGSDASDLDILTSFESPEKQASKAIWHS